MNERIKELMLEAKLGPALLLHHWGKIDALTDSEQEDLEKIEKFAELIVRECIVDFYRRYLDVTSNEDITVQVERYVKEHFRVE